VKAFHLVGISHKTAPVEWREKLAIPEDRLPEFLRGLKGPGVDEVAVLSTCNRVEVYAVLDDDAGARARLGEALARWQGDAKIAAGFYTEDGAAAARHLFRVAAGLDSLVVGEAEILGQVKRAYESARTLQATGKLTNVAFQRALYVGKSARARTALSEGPTSAASLAVALAERIFGDLKQSRVMLLGAGEMAELAARSLLSQKVSELTVLNRTEERARELARVFGGRAAPLERLDAELARADIVICSTGSPEPLIRAATVADAMRRRRGRSLFFIDIAVPRDVDAGVHKLENVYLYNIDDLQSIVAETLVRRGSDIDKASRWVDQKAEEFSGWYDAWRRGETSTFTHAAAATGRPGLSDGAAAATGRSGLPSAPAAAPVRRMGSDGSAEAPLPAAHRPALADKT
jgi:glutamyl-tRNA reductase